MASEAGWIKVRNKLYDDPDVAAIAGATGLDIFGVVGRLIKFWSWLDKHTEDGSANFLQDVHVLSAINRELVCDGFAEALVAIGWIEVSGGWLRIPQFGKHNGKTAKRRAKDAVRKADDREKSAESPRPVRNLSAESPQSKRTDCRPRLESEKDKKEEIQENPHTPFELSSEKPKKQREKRPTHEHGSLPIPEPLLTASFIEAWGRWIDYRRAQGLPYKVGHSEQAQLDWCVFHGPVKSIEFINESIRRGWRAVIDPGNSNHKPPHKPFKHAARSFD